jgi:hypothetical protein
MKTAARSKVIPASDGSGTGLRVHFTKNRSKEKSPARKWVPKSKITALVFEANAAKREALRKAIVAAAHKLGMSKELEAYLGIPVRASPGRRPGSLLRRKKPAIEGSERVRIARLVHQELGEPQIYEKLEHGALKAAVGRVAAKRGIADKVVDTCYREFGNKLRTEMSFVDWERWLKGYRAHVYAHARSGKPAITRGEALQFWRNRLLQNINRLAGL